MGLQLLGRKSIKLVLALALIAATIVVPQPQAHAAGKVYAKYAWSSCVWDVSGKPRYVSASEYRAAGSPPVWTVNRMAGDRVLHYRTTPSEIFLFQPPITGADYYTCHSKHLTASEWKALGSPYAEGVDNEFNKYRNSPTVYVSAYGPPYTALTYSQWQFYGAPTPAIW